MATIAELINAKELHPKKSAKIFVVVRGRSRGLQKCFGNMKIIEVY
jgi:hypothetical protein